MATLTLTTPGLIYVDCDTCNGAGHLSGYYAGMGDWDAECINCKGIGVVGLDPATLPSMVLRSVVNESVVGWADSEREAATAELARRA